MKNRFGFWILLCVCLITYVWCACQNLSLPGLQYDETLQASPAVHLVKGILNGTYIAVWQQRIGWRTVPIMNMEYMGALKSWCLAIAFKIFGIKVSVLRGIGVLGAAAGLLFLGLFARRLWGSAVAILAVMLMATDVIFIYCTRLDWGPVVIAFLMRTVSLWALANWYLASQTEEGKPGVKQQPAPQNPARYWLWIASGALGLGLFDKTNFLWFILAAGFVFMVFWWLNRKQLSLPIHDVLLAGGIFFITSLPLWIYNLVTGFRTFRLAKISGQEVGIAQLIEWIPERLQVIHSMLVGRSHDYFFFKQAFPKLPLGETSWLEALCLAAICGLVFLAGWKRRADLLIMPALIVLILVQIFLTPRPVWVHHWIGIYPLPQLAITIFIQALGKALHRERVVQTIGTIIIIGAVCVNLNLWRGYESLLLKTGGAETWSDAIYTLHQTLHREYSSRPIIVMDWGINNQLLFLSEGQLHLSESFWPYLNDSTPQQPLLAQIRDSQNVFVLHAPIQPVFSKPREALFQAAKQLGVRARIEQKLVERSGKEIFEIVTFSPEAITKK